MGEFQNICFLTQISVIIDKGYNFHVGIARSKIVNPVPRAELFREGWYGKRISTLH